MQALATAGTVRAVRWVSVDDDRRVRRLTNPFMRFGPDACEGFGQGTARRRVSQLTLRSLTEMKTSVLATAWSILRGMRQDGGMGGIAAARPRQASQRIRRMWMDCTSPNNAKYTIRLDPP